MAKEIERKFLVDQDLLPKNIIGEDIKDFIWKLLEWISSAPIIIKNIPYNTKVMGYPAKDLKNFIRENKWLIKLL